MHVIVKGHTIDAWNSKEQLKLTDDCSW